MERNIFNENISVFQISMKEQGGRLVQDSRQHFVRTLGQYLQAGAIYADTIRAIRQTRQAFAAEHAAHGDTPTYRQLIAKYNLLKWSAPVCIPQGVSETQKDDGFTSFSNVVCLDFDTEKPDKADNGNGWVKSWEEIRDAVAMVPFVSYAALSAGGQGIFVLVPIASHENHLEHWRALRRIFKDVYNLHVDESTKNLSRLRFMSHDPGARINKNAVVFEARDIEKPAEIPQNFAYKAAKRFAPDDDTARSVESLVQKIEQRHIDITPSYEEWMKLGAAIAHHFGEAGRPLFHRISCQYPAYNERESNMKYDSLMKTYTGRPANIESFYYLCKRYGITRDKQHGIRRNTMPGTKMQPIFTTPPPLPPIPPSAPRPQYDEGAAAFESIKQNNAPFGRLCDALALEYCGTMTAEEFDAIMTEKPQVIPF